jgi:hypothetical protein
VISPIVEPWVQSSLPKESESFESAWLILAFRT